MRKRIGNDIRFTWHVNRRNNGALVPESFIGKDVDVELLSPSRRTVEITDVRTAAGIVTFAFPGKNQTEYGAYTAVLYENRGADGMVAIDTVEAVTLVRHSFQEGNEGNDVIEAASVEIESELSANAGSSTEPVQADWAQTDDMALDYIKNKPDLDEYTKQVASKISSEQKYTGRHTITETLHQVIYPNNNYRKVEVQPEHIRVVDARGTDVKTIRMHFDNNYNPQIETLNDKVVWQSTASEQIPAATTSANGLMSAADKQKITDIEAVIPEQASSGNKLADKNFVNSSIATATATYRGSYNLVADLSLTISATHAQIATALATAIQTADNNDYCFVQIPVEDDTPTEIARVERYKFNGTAWEYEYMLNNSGFTAAQWAALNSGITSGLVTKLSAMPTNDELMTLLNGKANTRDLAEVATSGSYNDLADKPTIPTVPTNVSAFNNDAGYLTSNNASNTYEKKLTFTSLSSTSYTATGNYYYRHTNTVSNLTVTLPSSKSAGDMVVVNFTAGSSPSVSLSGNGTTVKYHSDYAITASKMNEIVCVYNGQYWLVTNTVFG